MSPASDTANCVVSQLMVKPGIDKLVVTYSRIESLPVSVAMPGGTTIASSAQNETIRSMSFPAVAAAAHSESMRRSSWTMSPVACMSLKPPSQLDLPSLDGHDPSGGLAGPGDASSTACSAGRDDGDAPVLALQLLLQRDELADSDLLLRTPPTAEEAEDEGHARGDLAERELTAGVLGQPEIGKRVAGHEIGPHRSPITRHPGGESDQGGKRVSAFAGVRLNQQVMTTPGWRPDRLASKSWSTVQRTLAAAENESGD